MSKRFGRNQKRKLREAVVAAERAADYWINRASGAEEAYRKMKDAYQSLEHHMQDWARRIVSALGEDSAFARKFLREVAEPWQIKVLLDPCGWQRHVPEKLGIHPFRYEGVANTVAERVCRLFPLFVDKIDDEYRMQRVIEFRVGPEERHKLYYAIDRRTLEGIFKTGEGHPLLRQMAHEMIKKAISNWEPKKEKVSG